jgi:hypothetical protein
MRELRHRECSEVYSLIKSTLLSEFGCGVPPSKLTDELNIYFVYQSTICNGESDFESTKGTD